MFELHKKKITIDSFEMVTLSTRGMRCADDYEIVKKDNTAEVSQYRISYREGKEDRILMRRAAVGENDILQMLNNCSILSWDGFHGKHPRGVKDGIMFSFSATVNGGKTIKADGSQNFPKHYRDFTQALHDILSNEIEK